MSSKVGAQKVVSNHDVVISDLIAEMKRIEQEAIDYHKLYEEIKKEYKKNDIRIKDLEKRISKLLASVNELKKEKQALLDLIASKDKLIKELKSNIAVRDSIIKQSKEESEKIKYEYEILINKNNLRRLDDSTLYARKFNDLEGLNENLMEHINKLYTQVDQLDLKVKGYQEDKVFKNVVNECELNETNTCEVKSSRLQRVTIETEKIFNTRQKALKYSLRYQNEGSSIEVLTDEPLWEGSNRRDIMTKKNDFGKYKDGKFELTVYYEEDGQKKTHIKKIFSWD